MINVFEINEKEMNCQKFAKHKYEKLAIYAYT